jgi:hypothetical protein
MHINELSSNSDKWYILSATSFLGVLKRAKEKNVEITSTDNVFDGKSVTPTQLIKAKSMNLIKDYSIDLTDDRLYIIGFIIYNDGSKTGLNRINIKFRL